MEPPSSASVKPVRRGCRDDAVEEVKCSDIYAEQLHVRSIVALILRE